MQAAYLEHANLTVKDPDSAAALLQRLFNWNIRWSGPSLDHGYTVHIGADSSYLALYTQPDVTAPTVDTYQTEGMLNHIGVVVDDLNAVEQKFIAEGLRTYSHGDYEPGRRFYADFTDGIEIEVCSYA